MAARHIPGGRRTQTSKGETARGVERLCVRRYGDFGAGGLLPTCVERLRELR